MKTFSHFEKLFLTSNNLMWAGNYVFDVILAFFIWGEDGNLQNLLIYKLFWTIGILPGVFGALILQQKINPLIVRVISFVIGILFALSLLIVPIEGITTLGVLGFVYGLKVGLGSQPYNLIFQIYIEPSNRTRFSSICDGVYQIIMLFFPLAVTQIIDITNSYNAVFIIGTILTIISIVPLTITLKDLKSYTIKKIDFPGAVEEIKQSKNLQKVFLLRFIDGIQNGFEMSILSVLGLFILSDIGNWGIVNTIINLVGVVILFTVSKNINFKKALPIFHIFAIVYSFATIVFAFQLNMLFYVVFLLANVFDRTLINKAYSAITLKIEDRRVEDSEHIDEYVTLAELPLFLGRAVPVLILLLVGSNIDGLGISIVLGIVSILPLIMTYVLDSIKLIERRDDPFICAD